MDDGSFAGKSTCFRSIEIEIVREDKEKQPQYYFVALKNNL